MHIGPSASSHTLLQSILNEIRLQCPTKADILRRTKHTHNTGPGVYHRCTGKSVVNGLVQQKEATSSPFGKIVTEFRLSWETP